MTDIAVYTVQEQAENLSWDLSTPQNPGHRVSGTIDVTLFTAAQHFPNGFIPSGTVLGKVTATGLLGPYLDAATDGRQTAVGYLAASTQVLQPNGTSKGKVGAAVLVAFAPVSVSKLPLTSGTAAAGGYIDANGQADLKNIYHAA